MSPGSRFPCCCCCCCQAAADRRAPSCSKFLPFNNLIDAGAVVRSPSNYMSTYMSTCRHVVRGTTCRRITCRCRPSRCSATAVAGPARSAAASSGSYRTIGATTRSTGRWHSRWTHLGALGSSGRDDQGGQPGHARFCGTATSSGQCRCGCPQDTAPSMPFREHAVAAREHIYRLSANVAGARRQWFTSVREKLDDHACSVVLSCSESKPLCHLTGVYAD